jgi:flagellar biosynthesis GTPase FlhF
MKPQSFVADNADAALAEAQRQLGPDAVVVSVRRLPAYGISRLWHHTGNVEVLARSPEPARHKTHSVPPGENAYIPFGETVEHSIPSGPTPRRWRSITWLESLGLLPVFGNHLEKKVSALHGEEPPAMPIEEWSAVRKVLAEFWHPARKLMEGTGRPHIFVGPPGSGKTTVLCKWMTQAALKHNQSVRVWRLDGDAANTAEFLSSHCEIIGVTADRFWRAPEEPADLFFVDLPGVETGNSHAMANLRAQVSALPNPHVHLVLNAAVDTAILFEQIHAFAPLGPEDVIFTHLDEERRRVKLWNFILGTNCSVSFLNAGQKIPGEFHRAESTLLFPCEIRP